MWNHMDLLLGQTLFYSILKSICNVLKLGKLILFLDGANIFCAGNNLKELHNLKE